MKVHCYARRRLRPFHGTVQTIAIQHPDNAGHGEAETSNGIDWSLYVGHPDLVAHTGLSEVRFGTWRTGDTAKRAAVRGTTRDVLIEDLGARLLDALHDHADKLPFTPIDRHECWLLDIHGAPLVLIDSVIDAEECTPWDRPNWHPGTAAEEGFTSPDGGVADLVRQVRERAGRCPRAAWIKRASDDAGTDQAGIAYPADRFPPTLLRTDWDNEADRRRAIAFIGWQAPWLLQLTGLDPALRAELERAAWQRPQEVARIWRLYPEILDTERLKVARIQASLMGESDARGLYQEPFLPVQVEV
ncbi:MAG: hypothetical protein H6981_06510 [Gammaproteobacteria bacterium]|nr:hypothetical protein [Gammaproteobacteria bacterium]MCP5136435.1 hypothetical protein [Gammaproteobacteria bacterium]